MPFDVDYNQAPLLLIWEVTRACALSCRHCRAEAIDERHPNELSLDEGRKLLDDIAGMGTPIVIFTGGDPLQRGDLDQLIMHAKANGLRVGTIPATTERLTRKRVHRLKVAGLDQMAMSIDGSTAETHDGFRRVPGCFDKAMEAAVFAHAEELPLQVNTVFAAWNFDDFDSMARLVQQLDVVFWEVFFLVPTGRGAVMGSCTTEQYEQLFEKLHQLSRRVDFVVKVTEAPHYRAYVARQTGPATEAQPDRGVMPSVHHGHHGSIHNPTGGVNSGKGFCFVDHVGDVCPSGFLPIVAGNVRTQSVIDIYRDSTLFRELRDPELLGGCCGMCEYKSLCGGSRARAHAMTDDYLAEEPFCAYGRQLVQGQDPGGVTS